MDKKNDIRFSSLFFPKATKCMVNGRSSDLLLVYRLPNSPGWVSGNDG